MGEHQGRGHDDQHHQGLPGLQHELLHAPLAVHRQLVGRVAAECDPLVIQRQRAEQGQPHPGGEVVAVHEGAAHRALVIVLEQPQQGLGPAPECRQPVNGVRQAGEGQPAQCRQRALAIAAQLESQQEYQAVSQQTEQGRGRVIGRQRHAAGQRLAQGFRVEAPERVFPGGRQRGTGLQESPCAHAQEQADQPWIEGQRHAAWPHHRGPGPGHGDHGHGHRAQAPGPFAIAAERQRGEHHRQQQQAQQQGVHARPVCSRRRASPSSTRQVSTPV